MEGGALRGLSRTKYQSKAGRRRPALQRHLARNVQRSGFCFAKLWECAQPAAVFGRPRVAFLQAHGKMSKAVVSIVSFGFGSARSRPPWPRFTSPPRQEEKTEVRGVLAREPRVFKEWRLLCTYCRRRMRWRFKRSSRKPNRSAACFIPPADGRASTPVRADSVNPKRRFPIPRDPLCQLDALSV